MRITLTRTVYRLQTAAVYTLTTSLTLLASYGLLVAFLVSLTNRFASSGLKRGVKRFLSIQVWLLVPVVVVRGCYRCVLCGCFFLFFVFCFVQIYSYIHLCRLGPETWFVVNCRDLLPLLGFVSFTWSDLGYRTDGID